MSDNSVNERVPIVVMPSSVKAMYGAQESKKIQRAVLERLLRPSKEPYHRVQVSVKHGTDGAPLALDAFMLRAYTYTADIVRLGIDADYNVVSVDTTYAGEEPRLRRPDPRPEARLPEDADMVFGTPVLEIPDGPRRRSRKLHDAIAAGFKAVKLLGPAANRANYAKYLTGHLKAFGNVGHGYTGGIVLADGNLTSAMVERLQRRALRPEVIYFNSCQVFNPPLQPAIMAAGARTFIGGKINLLIGDSEEVPASVKGSPQASAREDGPGPLDLRKGELPDTGRARDQRRSRLFPGGLALKEAGEGASEPAPGPEDATEAPARGRVAEASEAKRHVV
jgi:hypothetical protein